MVLEKHITYLRVIIIKITRLHINYLTLSALGRDASRLFITGKFSNKNVADDVMGLKHQELISLNNWLKFYEKEYEKVGR